jgi:hypothetical protein
MRSRRRLWAVGSSLFAALIVATIGSAGQPRPLENAGERCALAATWTYTYRQGGGRRIKVSGVVRWRRATFDVSNRLYAFWPEIPSIGQPSFGLRVFMTGGETPMKITSSEPAVRGRTFQQVATLLVLTPRRRGYLVRWLPTGLPLPGRRPLRGLAAAALPARTYSRRSLAARRVVLSLVGTKRFDFVDRGVRYRGTLTYSLAATFSRSGG